MPPVDGKARFRRRQRAQRLDSELNDLGVKWWHIVFALPAAAISVSIDTFGYQLLHLHATF